MSDILLCDTPFTNIEAKLFNKSVIVAKAIFTEQNCRAILQKFLKHIKNASWVFRDEKLKILSITENMCIFDREFDPPPNSCHHNVIIKMFSSPLRTKKDERIIFFSFEDGVDYSGHSLLCQILFYKVFLNPHTPDQIDKLEMNIENTLKSCEHERMF